MAKVASQALTTMATQLALARTTALTTAGPSKVSSKTVPAFLNKLYNMVDDPSTDSLIKWSESGDSFLVLDQEHFAREVLGYWFKHQNFTSFVRQLNMYGFRKVPHLQQGVLRAETDNEVVVFENPNFKRNQPDLLCLIQRKKQAPNASSITELISSEGAEEGTSQGTVVDVKTLINGISVIKRHQSTISSELKALQQSNQHLWQEAISARERHKKHEDTLNRILKFLAGVFGTTASPSGQSSPGARKRTSVVPVKRARLMIEDGSVVKESRVNPLDYEGDDLTEDIDLPVGVDTDNADSGRFTIIDNSRTEIPEQSGSRPQVTPTPLTDTSPRHNMSEQGIDDTPAMESLVDFPSDRQETDSGRLSPNSLMKLAAGDVGDPAVSDWFMNFINSTPPDEVQRLMSALACDPPTLPGLDHDVVSQRESTQPVHSLTAPRLSAAPSALHPIAPSQDVNAKQIQRAAYDAADIKARSDAIDGDINTLIDSLPFDLNNLQGDYNFPSDQTLSGELTQSQPETSNDFDFNSFLTSDSSRDLGADAWWDRETSARPGEPSSAYLSEVHSPNASSPLSNVVEDWTPSAKEKKRKSTSTTPSSLPMGQSANLNKKRRR